MNISKSKIKYLVRLAIPLLIFSGCSNNNFKKFSELGDLRILAVVADIPEVDGNSTSPVSVTLTPYISDVTAAGRIFNVNVFSCLDPSFSQLGDVGCDNPQVEAYPNGNTFDAGTLAATNFSGAMDAITISIPNPSVLIAGYSNQQKHNGISYLVAFALESGGEELTVIKSISISTRAVLNTNPVIQDILLDGSSIGSGPTTSGELDLTYTAPGSPEAYSEMLSDGSFESRTESYVTTWFYSDGEVSPARILENQKSFYEAKNTSPIGLIGVLRDRRGGVDVRILNP